MQHLQRSKIIYGLNLSIPFWPANGDWVDFPQGFGTANTKAFSFYCSPLCEIGLKTPLLIDNSIIGLCLLLNWLHLFRNIISRFSVRYKWFCYIQFYNQLPLLTSLYLLLVRRMLCHGKAHLVLWAYVKLRFAHEPGMQGTFFPPSTPKETAS